MTKKYANFSVASRFTFKSKLKMKHPIIAWKCRLIIYMYGLIWTWGTVLIYMGIWVCMYIYMCVYVHMFECMDTSMYVWMYTPVTTLEDEKRS